MPYMRLKIWEVVWHWFAASITGNSQSAQMGPLTLQVM